MSTKLYPEPHKGLAMDPTSRRRFLYAAALLSATALTTSSFSPKKHTPLLSFSTLGCPDWPFEKIISFAARHGYAGIELRGLLRVMDLTRCPQFADAASIASTLRQMKDHRLSFADLGSSCMLHFPEGAERNSNLEEARRFIDLAAGIECPFVRVFPNEFPEGIPRQQTLDRIARGLEQLAAHAKGSGVSVLVETHGALVETADIITVMKAAAGPCAGLVWDVTNMWTVTGQSPAEVYGILQPYIRHTHIKDAVKTGSEVTYTLLGQGSVPIFEAIDALEAGGYTGYYSFEWEKLWHPEIGDPETALADYSQKMKRHFASRATGRATP